jgi:chemotaxis protein methyltransferase CheR
MDVIFCRNVIIYFDQESKRKVISTLHNQLLKGGYLLLGHSESLMNISTEFDLRHFIHDMVYQRPDALQEVR